MGIKQKEENTNGGLHNTLAAGTTVKGDIVTETDFRLDGKNRGNVSCNGKIVIGPERECHRKHRFCKCRNIGRSGRFHTRQCQIFVLKSDQPSSKAIYSPKRWKIEPNARFNGVCKDVRGKITTNFFFPIHKIKPQEVGSFPLHNSMAFYFISGQSLLAQQNFHTCPIFQDNNIDALRQAGYFAIAIR